MPTTAIIPIRSFTTGKGRLGDHLTSARRTELSMGMAERTVSAAEEAKMIPTIVSSATDVADWAIHLGLLLLNESRPGLNPAAERGVSWALAEGLQWIVLHADLPLVSAADLSSLREVVESGGDAIAPSCDGGTSALSCRSTITFGYGPGSFHTHLPRMTQPTILTPTGLLHDLDSMDDLVAAAEHPRGRWLRHLVA